MQHGTKWTASLGSAVRLLVVAICGGMGCAERVGAQLVVGTSNGGASEITLIDLSGSTPPRVLVEGFRVFGLAADEDGQTLYWSSQDNPRRVYKAAYATSGQLTPVLVGNYPAPLNAAPHRVLGLAWDKAAHELIAFDAIGRAWFIDTTVAPTLTATLRWDSNSFEQAFVGADYDPLSDSFYGVNQAQDGIGSAFPGLFRLTKPWASPTWTRVAPLPAEVHGGLGLAIGNGRAYPLNQFHEQSVYNLATNTYELPAPQISISAINGATWAPGLLLPPAGTNLVLSAGSSEACSVPVGGTLVFSVRLDNYGASPSGPVALTVDLNLDGNAAFGSSTPSPTSSTPTQLLYALPSIPAYGPAAYTNVVVHLNALTPGAVVSVSASALVASDINPLDNSATASTSIRGVAPPSAAIKGLLSTLPPLANSRVPNGEGARFVSFEDPIASPSGNRWSVKGKLIPTPGQTTPIPNFPLPKTVVVRGTTGGATERVLQADLTVVGSHGALDSSTSLLDINDAGLLLFSGAGTLATTTDGLVFTDIAATGAAVPSMPGVTYDANVARAGMIFDNGQVSFVKQGFDPSSTPDTVFTGSGSSIFAQLNATVPVGASAPLSAFTTDVAFTDGFGMARFDRSGSHSIYAAEINTGSDLNNGVVVADGTVILQEGVTPIAGTSRTFEYHALGYERVHMAPDGSAFMVFDGSDAERDVVIRGSGTAITQILKTGDPIAAGSSESWSDVRFPYTFLTFQPGPAGHFVVGGYTDAADESKDFALVYDNRVVIARENDPIDLDGNGVFDDRVYIGSLHSFFFPSSGSNVPTGVVAFTNDNAILASVYLRDEKAALCEADDQYLHTAIVRIPLPPHVACCTPAGACSLQVVEACASPNTAQGFGSTCTPNNCPQPPGVCCRGSTCNASVGQGSCVSAGAAAGATFATSGATCNAPGTYATPCCHSDYNKAGGTTVADIFSYLTDWFAQSSYAIVGGDGSTGVPTVAHIFNFLSAWFAGGC